VLTLTLAMTPGQANGMALPIQMLADVFAVALHWRRWDRRLVWLLIPGSIVGVTIGMILFFAHVPGVALKRVLGVIVVLFVIYKLFEGRILGSITYKSRGWHGWAAGLLAGFGSALAQNGGPPVTIYLLMHDITPRVFIATSALFFFILNWIKVPYYAYAGLFDFGRLWQIAWLLPVVPLGVWVGRLVGDKVDEITFERIIIVLLAITAVLLIAG
jgi:uncharacterized membrane protein YfcA